MSDSRDATALHFSSLSLRRMPGIDPPGVSLPEISPGVNIIHGPNAAGKTTVARAFNLLLWPDAGPSRQAILRAEFELGERNWHVKLDGGDRIFQRKGSQVNAPGLPSSDQADRYNLPLHDLLQESTTNQEFAERIVRELFGGYDIPSAMENLGFDDSPSGIGNTTRNARNAVKKLEEVREELKYLEEEDDELRRLTRRRHEAEEAHRQLGILKQVAEWNRAQEKYQQAKNQLDRFPDVMERVTGREMEQLSQLQESLDQREVQAEQAEKNIETYEKTLEELEYPYDTPATETRAELRQRFEEIREWERDIQTIRNNLEEARARRSQEADNLSENIELDPDQSFSRVDYGELEGFARRAETTRVELDTLKRFKDLLEPDSESTDTDYDAVNRGTNILENWLSHPPEQQPVSSSTWYALGGAVIVIILISGIAGYLLHPGFYGGVLIALLLGWYGRTATDFDSEGMRRPARREYEELDLDLQPDSWDENAVRSTLRDLYERRAQAILHDRLQTEWNRELETYQQLQNEWEKIENKREQYIEELGFAPDTQARTLFLLFNRLSRWQDHQSAVKGLEEKLEQAIETRDRSLGQVNEEFRKWNLPEAENGAEVKGGLAEIELRIETYRETTTALERAREKLKEAEQTLPGYREERDNLYTNLNLEPGDESGLRELGGRHEDYKECREEITRKQSVLENEREKMESMDGFDPDYRELSREQLENRLEQARHTAEQLEEIRDRISSIETKISQAKSTYELEPALSNKQRALDVLADQLDKDYENVVGHALGNHIQQVDQRQRLPWVFEYARDLLATLTAGQYELEVNQDDPPSFRVIDSTTGEGKSLGELSSGTRVQVLLAVRLAFVEHGENNTKMPIYMDETLANADDLRARMIIESTLELARLGRQVFYFTAQGDEVAKWQSVADKQSVELNVIDLAEQTEQQINSVPIPDMTEFEPLTEPIPDSSGHPHADYGKRLAVPSINPHQDLGSIHLWYLIDDVKLLERYLSRRIQTWGQLETLLKLGNRHLVEEEERDRLDRARELANAMGVFLEHRRQGLNRPVDRAVLKQSGAVSDNFIEDVTALAEQHGGDPERLIEVLREGGVSGFRTNKMDQLEDYLLTEGYIDDRETPSPEITRAHMIETLDEETIHNPEATVDNLLERISTDMA